ncbi:MAG TPA: hypothetical protein VFB34_04895 [Chloroflexota bacterium]|nr:hypothetical protein [Chloroflexota bacterium]
MQLHCTYAWSRKFFLEAVHILQGELRSLLVPALSVARIRIFHGVLHHLFRFGPHPRFILLGIGVIVLVLLGALAVMLVRQRPVRGS